MQQHRSQPTTTLRRRDLVFILIICVGILCNVITDVSMLYSTHANAKVLLEDNIQCEVVASTPTDTSIEVESTPTASPTKYAENQANMSESSYVTINTPRVRVTLQENETQIGGTTETVSNTSTQVDSTPSQDIEGTALEHTQTMDDEAQPTEESVPEIETASETAEETDSEILDDESEVSEEYETQEAKEAPAPEEFFEVSEPSYSGYSHNVLNPIDGVCYFNNHIETWYSQRVLPGGGLDIPGRHVDENGLIRDCDGYICVAADPSYLPKGSIVETSLGLGKVYDTGCPYGYIDVYVDW